MAAMALVGLKYLDEDNARRRQICSIYDNAFEKEGISYIKQHSDCVIPSRHLYQITIQNRNSIMEKLNFDGIYPGVHYRDNTFYKMYKYGFGKCPNSHSISEEIISLPLHLNLSDEDVNRVIEKIISANKFFNK